jgi:hypothetical protein
LSSKAICLQETAIEENIYFLEQSLTSHMPSSNRVPRKHLFHKVKPQTPNAINKQGSNDRAIFFVGMEM